MLRFHFYKYLSYVHYSTAFVFSEGCIRIAKCFQVSPCLGCRPIFCRHNECSVSSLLRTLDSKNTQKKKINESVTQVWPYHILTNILNILISNSSIGSRNQDLTFRFVRNARFKYDLLTGACRRCMKYF